MRLNGYAEIEFYFIGL